MKHRWNRILYNANKEGFKFFNLITLFQLFVVQ